MLATIMFFAGYDRIHTTHFAFEGGCDGCVSSATLHLRGGLDDGGYLYFEAYGLDFETKSMPLPPCTRSMILFIAVAATNY